MQVSGAPWTAENHRRKGRKGRKLNFWLVASAGAKGGTSVNSPSGELLVRSLSASTANALMSISSKASRQALSLFGALKRRAEGRKPARVATAFRACRTVFTSRRHGKRIESSLVRSRWQSHREQFCAAYTVR